MAPAFLGENFPASVRRIASSQQLCFDSRLLSSPALNGERRRGNRHNPAQVLPNHAAVHDGPELFRDTRAANPKNCVSAAPLLRWLSLLRFCSFL